MLGENVILLEAPKDIAIDQIHASSKAIEVLLGGQLLDIVPAYDSIAIFTNRDRNQITQLLSDQRLTPSIQSGPLNIQVIPICYELGLDWDRMEEHTGISQKELITLHLEGTYQNLFMGFTPGFIYAGGLHPLMACPRRRSPRAHIEAGSVGVGGSQTGIYSLYGPGGWNIIGKTPSRLFDVSKRPPVAINVGQRFRFKRISEKELRKWEN